MTLYFKGCPKCTGDMEDTPEGDQRCFQCGHYVYAATTALYAEHYRDMKQDLVIHGYQRSKQGSA